VCKGQVGPFPRAAMPIQSCPDTHFADEQMSGLHEARRAANGKRSGVRVHFALVHQTFVVMQEFESRSFGSVIQALRVRVDLSRMAASVVDLAQDPVGRLAPA